MTQQIEEWIRTRNLPGLSEGAINRLLNVLASDEKVEQGFKDEEFTFSRRSAWMICAGVVPIVAVTATTIFYSSFFETKSQSDPVSQSLKIDSSAIKKDTANLIRRPTDKDSPSQNLRIRSPQQRVKDAEVIIVANGLKFDLAPPKSLGDAPEYFITFKVLDVLKGDLMQKTIVTRTPTDPNEYINKEKIVMLSPEYMKSLHDFASISTIKQEAEIRRLIKEELKEKH